MRILLAASEPSASGKFMESYKALSALVVLGIVLPPSLTELLRKVVEIVSP